MTSERAQQLDPAGAASLPGPAEALPPPPPPSSGARPEAPECEKLVAVADESHKLGEFLDWLEAKGYVLAVSDEEGRLWPAPIGGYERLLARFFKIDLDKVEQERRAILAHVRSTHAQG